MEAAERLWLKRSDQPCWVTWVRAYDVKRPETPRTITENVSQCILGCIFGSLRL